MKIMHILFFLYVVVFATLIVNSDDNDVSVVPLVPIDDAAQAKEAIEEITNETAVEEATIFSSVTTGLGGLKKMIKWMVYFISAVTFGFAEYLETVWGIHSAVAQMLEYVLAFLYLLGIMEFISARRFGGL